MLQVICLTTGCHHHPSQQVGEATSRWRGWYVSVSCNTGWKCLQILFTLLCACLLGAGAFSLFLQVLVVKESGQRVPKEDGLFIGKLGSAIIFLSCWQKMAWLVLDTQIHRQRINSACTHIHTQVHTYIRTQSHKRRHTYTHSSWTAEARKQVSCRRVYSDSWAFRSDDLSVWPTAWCNGLCRMSACLLIIHTSRPLDVSGIVTNRELRVDRDDMHKIQNIWWNKIRPYTIFCAWLSLWRTFIHSTVVFACYSHRVSELTCTHCTTGHDLAHLEFSVWPDKSDACYSRSHLHKHPGVLKLARKSKP